MNGLDRLRLERLVDRLLATWDRPAGPGMTLGLALEDELVVHRSAGLASIELGVQIGPATTFRIASVSKQFTCAAILLLAAEGKLRVEDDVRDWLPELRDFGVRITLDQLMHNTSGIRDMLEIMRWGGIDLAQPVTHDDLMAGICRQRGLNFPPGSRYL
jgi:CubicO group peptidase (beta-lactamase class C family)